jgi:hypothetical protein
LLARIGAGRLELIGVLADLLEEQGDTRCVALRREADFLDDLARAWERLPPPPPTDEGLARLAMLYDMCRQDIGRLFGRRWRSLSPARALRLLRPPAGRD